MLKYINMKKEAKQNNITLIGMAGVGKSFVGKHVAEKMGFNYEEIDRLIALELEKKNIDKHFLSDREFMDFEEKAVLSMERKKKFIFDPGGSIVYSGKAMEWLKNNSLVVYLKDLPANIKKRFDERNEVFLVGIKGKKFEELLDERSALYEKYADFIVDVSEYENFDGVLNKVIKLINLNKNMIINFDDFKKVEIKIGKVVVAERVEGSEKLIRLEVDLGEESLRQIVAGIGKVYSPEDLVGREMPIVANLEPRKLMGLESQGMILAADNDGEPVVLHPGKDVPPGAVIK
jgi:methionine--tRNA ligase beta chain